MVITKIKVCLTIEKARIGYRYYYQKWYINHGIVGTIRKIYINTIFIHSKRFLNTKQLKDISNEVYIKKMDKVVTEIVKIYI